MEICADRLAKMKEDSTSFVAAPIAEMMEMVLPNDANILGNILGGNVMHLVDICAATAASRHCRRPVVTASIDSLEFRYPIKVGELIIVKAALNRAFKTSMEIGAKVWSENLLTGECKHTSSAYLTFVALDESGKPTMVPPYQPVTPEETRRWHDANVRRENRLVIKARLSQRKAE
jgi:acyl-CoA hydrolase